MEGGQHIDFTLINPLVIGGESKMTGTGWASSTIDNENKLMNPELLGIT
jgi:hypothetical protein